LRSLIVKLIGARRCARVTDERDALPVIGHLITPFSRSRPVRGASAVLASALVRGLDRCAAP